MKKILFLLLLFFSSSLLALDVPKLDSRVIDTASLLSKSEEAKLEKELKKIEDSTSNQIVLLTIKSLEGDSLEEYSIKVVEKWKLGQKDKDNGILILVVKDSRDIRIEVGYGLEGALPDSLAGSIIRHEFTPLMKEGKFFEAFSKGIENIHKAIQGEYEATTNNEALVLIIFFVLLLIAAFLATEVHRIVAGVFGGISAPLVWMFLVSEKIEVLTVVAIIGAIVAAFADLVLEKLAKGGSSSSSSGGSSSSYRGGDGGFGGGGASGKW